MVRLVFWVWLLSGLEQLSLGPSTTQFVLNIWSLYFCDSVSPLAEWEEKLIFALQWCGDAHSITVVIHSDCGVMYMMFMY